MESFLKTEKQKTVLLQNVGLSFQVLFGYLFQSPVKQFWDPTYRILLWSRITGKTFTRIVRTVFEETKKSPEMLFLIKFGLNLAMFLRSPPHDFDATAQTGH